MSEVSVIKEGWLHKRGERCPACPVGGPELPAVLLPQWRSLPWATGSSGESGGSLLWLQLVEALGSLPRGALGHRAAFPPTQGRPNGCILCHSCASVVCTLMGLGSTIQDSLVVGQPSGGVLARAPCPSPELLLLLQSWFLADKYRPQLGAILVLPWPGGVAAVASLGLLFPRGAWREEQPPRKLWPGLSCPEQNPGGFLPWSSRWPPLPTHRSSFSSRWKRRLGCSGQVT